MIDMSEMKLEKNCFFKEKRSYLSKTIWSYTTTEIAFLFILYGLRRQCGYLKTHRSKRALNKSD